MAVFLCLASPVFEVGPDLVGVNVKVAVGPFAQGDGHEHVFVLLFSFVFWDIFLSILLVPVGCVFSFHCRATLILGSICGRSAA